MEFFLKTDNNVFLSNTSTDRINRSQFLKSGITIDITKDRLLLNYDVFTSNGDSEIEGLVKDLVR